MYWCLNTIQNSQLQKQQRHTQILWMENGGLIYWEGKKLLHRQLLCLMDHLLTLGVSSTTGVCSSILHKIFIEWTMALYKPQVTQVTCRPDDVCRIVYSCSSPGVQDGCGSSCKLRDGIKEEKRDLKDLKLSYTVQKMKRWPQVDFLVFKMLLWVKFYQNFLFSPTQITSFTISKYFNRLRISSSTSVFHIYEMSWFNNNNNVVKPKTSIWSIWNQPALHPDSCASESVWDVTEISQAIGMKRRKDRGLEVPRLNYLSICLLLEHTALWLEGSSTHLK